MSWVFAGLIAVGAADGSEGPAVETLRRYAEQLRSVESLHFDFVSIVRGKTRITKRIGHYDFDVVTGNAFLEFAEETDGKAEGRRRIAWKGGIAKEEIFPAGAVLPGGRILGTRPLHLRLLSLPSEHPLFLRDHPLAAILKEYRLSEMRLDAENAKRRILLWPQASVQGRRCPAFGFDVSLEDEDFLTDVWAYDAKGEIRGSKSAASELRVPCEDGSAIASRHWRIEGYASTSGVRLPSRWSASSPLLVPDVRVEIDTSSMQINSRPTHDYDFQWSPGTRVADEFSGEIMQAGSEGIEGDAISQALLDKILMEAGFGEAGGAPDWSPLPSACGANALYLICRLMGKDVTLREIVRALGLREDSEERNVNVETLCGAAKTFGLTPIAVRGGTDLLTAPSRAPVIAHAVGRKGRWHYTVIWGFDESTRELRILDMPFRPLRLKLSTFAKDWSGVAILFHPDDLADARAAGRGRAILWACGAAVGAVVLTLIGFAICRRWRRAAAGLVEEPSR